MHKLQWRQALIRRIQAQLRREDVTQDEREEDRSNLGLESDTPGVHRQDRRAPSRGAPRNRRVHFVDESIERIEELPEQMLIQIPRPPLERVLKSEKMVHLL